MSKPAYSVNEAAHAFLKALHDYQCATRDMNVSLQRLYGHLYNFGDPLKRIVQITGSAARPELIPAAHARARLGAPAPGR